MDRRISVIHPSFGRPEQAVLCHHEWVMAETNHEEIEWIIVTGITASFGFVIAGEAYLRALGHEPTVAHEARFRVFLGELLRERLFREPGRCDARGVVAS